jgi:splicing factor U2AF subunit
MIPANVRCIEICEDIEEECEKYGKILEMKIPRPSGGSRQSAGVGKIYIKYDTPESAKKALQALAGRKFADRTVVTTYFDEVSTLEKFRGPLS